MNGYDEERTEHIQKKNQSNFLCVKNYIRQAFKTNLEIHITSWPLEKL